MGGVSNGDDFLSPWSELPPPWADDMWRTTTGIVQVDAQARARPRTAQHVWVGRDPWLGSGGRGGRSGQSRRQLYLPSSSPPTTGLGSLLLRATSGSTTSPFLAPLPAQGPLPEESNTRVDRSRVRLTPTAHHVV